MSSACDVIVTALIARLFGEGRKPTYCGKNLTLFYCNCNKEEIDDEKSFIYTIANVFRVMVCFSFGDRTSTCVFSLLFDLRQRIAIHLSFQFFQSDYISLSGNF